MFNKSIHPKNIKLNCLDIERHLRFHRDQCDKFRKKLYGINKLSDVVEEYIIHCDLIAGLHQTVCNRGAVRKFLGYKVARNLAVFNLVKAIQNEKDRNSEVTRGAVRGLLQLIESRIQERIGANGFDELVRMLNVGHYDDYVRQVGVVGYVVILEVCNEKVSKVYNTWLGDVEKKMAEDMENGLDELDKLYHAAELDSLTRCVENVGPSYLRLIQDLVRGDKKVQKDFRRENAEKPQGYWGIVKQRDSFQAVWTERNRARAQNVLWHRRRGRRNT